MPQVALIRAQHNQPTTLRQLRRTQDVARCLLNVGFNLDLNGLQPASLSRASNCDNIITSEPFAATNLVCLLLPPPADMCDTGI